MRPSNGAAEAPAKFESDWKTTNIDFVSSLVFEIIRLDVLGDSAKDPLCYTPTLFVTCASICVEELLCVIYMLMNLTPSKDNHWNCKHQGLPSHLGFIAITIIIIRFHHHCHHPGGHRRDKQAMTKLVFTLVLHWLTWWDHCENWFCLISSVWKTAWSRHQFGLEHQEYIMDVYMLFMWRDVSFTNLDF